jgi:ABC-type transport system involved in multi-copper enzyme maturation permease subunit
MRRLAALIGRSASQMRYGIAGSLALACAFQIVLVGEAVRLAKTQSFGLVAGLLPQFLQRGLGNQLMTVASFQGTIIFGYVHPLVCLLIPLVAMYAATEPAHDVEARLVDLVLARSMRRSLLLTRSLLLAAAYIVAAALLTAAGTWGGVELFHARPYGVPSVPVIAQLLWHLIALAFSVAAFGLCLGAFMRRRAGAFTAGALIVVLLYVIEVLAVGSPVLERLASLSPFHYDDAFAIAAGQAPELRDLAVLAGAAAVFSAAAFWRFGRRDL